MSTIRQLVDEEVHTPKTLEEATQRLRTELENIAEGYITVGYLLKKTRDNKLYTEAGYEDIYAYAQDVFNVSRSWATRFMQINDTYSIDGSSPHIQDKYKGYGSSKLSEMLALPEEIRDEVPQDATVADIRGVKETIRDTEGKYDPQMDLCDIAQESEESAFNGDWMQKLVLDYFRTEKTTFEQFVKWMNKETITTNMFAEIMAIVNPSKFKMVRLDTANVLMSENAIKVMPYVGHGQQSDYTYLEFAAAFEELFYPGEKAVPLKAEEPYFTVYETPLHEKKEERKKETKKEVSKTSTKPVKPQCDIASKKQQKEDKKESKTDSESIVSPPAEYQELSQNEENVENETKTEDEMPTNVDFPQCESDLEVEKPIWDILTNGKLNNISKLLEQEFAEPAEGWDDWMNKVVKL
jgi:hypothetical protein